MEGVVTKVLRTRDQGHPFHRTGVHFRLPPQGCRWGGRTMKGRLRGCYAPQLIPSAFCWGMVSAAARGPQRTSRPDAVVTVSTSSDAMDKPTRPFGSWDGSVD